MIELKQVSKSFGNRHILNGVNLSVADGETLVILGASGSGKSTILKLIIGLLQPDAGDVLIHGQNVTAITEDAWNKVRRHMGWYFSIPRCLIP